MVKMFTFALLLNRLQQLDRRKVQPAMMEQMEFWKLVEGTILA